MVNDYIQISIPTSDPGESEMLIALLSESGFEGFEEVGDTLQAFIRQDEFHDEDIRELLASQQFEYSMKIIPEQNWNENWEQHFEPVCINDFCGIRASFHEPMKNVMHEIIITPKMSFGTGHHDTTRLMIEAMSELNFNGKKVLDFGTGTGILAILAEQLGATDIVAIDHDDWSIQNAGENIQANNCKKIELKKQDHLGLGSRFDFILANINKNVIINNLRFLSQHLHKEGVLLLSGLLSDDFGEIQFALAAQHFSISYQRQSNNWICLLCYQTG